jgi:hypothetical protein
MGPGRYPCSCNRRRYAIAYTYTYCYCNGDRDGDGDTYRVPQRYTDCDSSTITNANPNGDDLAHGYAQGNTKASADSASAAVR